ncbi:natural cytotoxicity triggering receptor 3 ligand 1-like [Cetorhinus maximus]
MSAFDLPSYLSVLGIIYIGLCTVTEGSSLSVRQLPIRVTAVKRTNVSIYCSIPLFDHNTWVDVYWRRDGQEGILDLTADTTKIMTPFRQGSAELRLLKVNFQDSGVYYCSARVNGKISNGNGTELIVYVPPTPVKITRVSSTFLTLLCTTAGFFPKEFNLTWYKNNIEITSGMKITEIQNEGGLYQVSSLLNLPEAGSAYTCQVSHISLENPANDSYMVRSQGCARRSDGESALCCSQPQRARKCLEFQMCGRGPRPCTGQAR